MNFILMLRILPHLPWKNFILKGILDNVRKVSNAVILKDYTEWREDSGWLESQDTFAF